MINMKQYGRILSPIKPIVQDVLLKLAQQLVQLLSLVIWKQFLRAPIHLHTLFSLVMETASL